MFFSLTLIDTYRMATHDWDTQYAPWPFKGAGAVDRTEDEQMLTITMAVTTSLVIALVDFVIHRYKRAQEARKREALPAGVPIIIRTPLSQEATESAAAEAP
jgi:hypothetical protein